MQCAPRVRVPRVSQIVVEVVGHVHLGAGHEAAVAEDRQDALHGRVKFACKFCEFG